MGGHFPQSRTYSLIMSSSEDSYQRGCSFCSATASASAAAVAAAPAPAPAPAYPSDSAGESGTNADSAAMPSEEYLPQLRRRVMKKSYSCDSECRSVPGMGMGMAMGVGLGGGTLARLAARRRQLQRCSSCSCSTATTTTTPAVAATTAMAAGSGATAFTSSSSVETRRPVRPVWVYDYSW